MSLQQKKQTIKKDPWLLSKILYPKYTFEDFHREWFYQAWDNIEDLCLASRGFSKSTVRTVIFTLAKMIFNPDVTILLLGNTASQSAKFCGEIKEHIEKNVLLKMMYPQLVPGKKWSESELKLDTVTKIQKESTITAMGYGGALTELHFDIVIADDIVDFENAESKGQRDKLMRWFHTTVMPLVKDELHFNGTRYHQEDYYNTLLERNILTNKKSHKAITDEGKSFWPAMFPIEDLLKKKSILGSIIFNAQYQNDVLLMTEGQLIMRKWFKYISKNLLPLGLRIVQICDLAISQKETSDYFIESTFGLDMKEGNIYYLDIDRGHYSWNEQKLAIRRNNDKWKTLVGQVLIYIEGTQYQRVLADEMNTNIDLSITPFYPVVDKVTRLRGISPKFETGKFYFVKGLPLLDVIEDELCIFPDGEHDDIVDTISAIQKISSKTAPQVRWLD
jgi:predicted phage terminase large subunit-like protein